MTHQALFAELATKEKPTAKELMEASRKLEEIAIIAFMEEYGYPEAAAEMRERMGKA